MVARAARATFGTRIAVPFDPDEDEHKSRKNLLFRGPEGAFWIEGGFSPLILKVCAGLQSVEIEGVTAVYERLTLSVYSLKSLGMTPAINTRSDGCPVVSLVTLIASRS